MNYSELEQNSSYAFSSLSGLQENIDSIIQPIQPIQPNNVLHKIIKMKEDIIISMKENTVLDDNDNMEYLDTISDEFIKFMKMFSKERDKLLDVESKMKECEKKTERDLKTITTFINFLQNINKDYNEDTSNLEKPISEIIEKIKLNNKYKDCKKKYDIQKNIYSKHLNILRIVNQMNVGSTCSICLQENVNSYFNPCGHTACEKCCEKYINMTDDNMMDDNMMDDTKKCPLCRTYVLDIKKLYFN